MCENAKMQSVMWYGVVMRVIDMRLAVEMSMFIYDL